MAAEPKRSFKRTVAGTVENRSPRFLLGSLALAMVIALLAGLGIGIKVGEHNKAKKAKPAAVKPIHTRTTRRPTTSAGGAKAPIKAVVVKNGSKGLLVTRGTRRLALALVKLTRIDLLAPAAPSDIKAGNHVLFVVGGGAGARTAKEVIIVTGTTKRRLGTLVASATANSMTFKVKGKTVTLSTAGAKVAKTVAGKRTNLTTGTHVLIKTLLPAAPKKKPKKVFVKRQVIAVEIVVLPAASAFA